MTLVSELSASESVYNFVVGTVTFNSQTQGQTFDDIKISPDFPYLSSITMIAPSPDWFSGFYDFDPRNATASLWLRSFTLATYPWDAGTETGDSYSLSNPSQVPQLPIQQLTIDTIPGTTLVFANASGTTVLPVAQWSCQLTNEQPVCKATSETCVAHTDCCSSRCGFFLKKCRAAYLPRANRAGLRLGNQNGRGGAAARGGTDGGNIRSLSFA